MIPFRHSRGAISEANQKLEQYCGSCLHLLAHRARLNMISSRCYQRDKASLYVNSISRQPLVLNAKDRLQLKKSGTQERIPLTSSTVLRAVYLSQWDVLDFNTSTVLLVHGSTGIQVVVGPDLLRTSWISTLR